MGYYTDARFNESEAAEYAHEMASKYIPELIAALQPDPERGSIYHTAREMGCDFGANMPWSRQPFEAVARILRDTADYQALLEHVDAHFGTGAREHFDLSEAMLEQLRA